MKYNRRLFLRNSGLFASGIALAGIGCASPSNKDEGENTDTAKTTDTTSNVVAAQPLGPFGLQLYTLRDDLPKDPKGILKQVADMGYKQIEGYEGPKGLWWGMKNKEFKSYLDELGLVMISSHCEFKKDFERKAGEAGEIGLKYLIAPWLGPQKKLDDFKKFAETFNKCGDICKKHGLKFAYHNHGYGLKEMDGQIPLKLILDGTDPSLVFFEMDLYWTTAGGADPVAYLESFKNRYRLMHVKDMSKKVQFSGDGGSPEQWIELFPYMTTAGSGVIDLKTILPKAKENGVQHFIVEQDMVAQPEVNLKKSFDYLAAL